jgi:hypothetical protein
MALRGGRIGSLSRTAVAYCAAGGAGAISFDGSAAGDTSLSTDPPAHAAAKITAATTAVHFGTWIMRIMLIE